MQNSSEFQFVAVDTIHESTTNPRQTFEPTKLEELAESIRQHGIMQPITVRPNANGFELVTGARRFRAAQLAEAFSLPARIVRLSDAEAMEWQLVEFATGRCAPVRRGARLPASLTHARLRCGHDC